MRGRCRRAQRRGEVLLFAAPRSPRSHPAGDLRSDSASGRCSKTCESPSTPQGVRHAVSKLAAPNSITSIPGSRPVRRPSARMRPSRRSLARAARCFGRVRVTTGPRARRGVPAARRHGDGNRIGDPHQRAEKAGPLEQARAGEGFEPRSRLVRDMPSCRKKIESARKARPGWSMPTKAAYAMMLRLCSPR